ncbi:hypothetical protein BBJ28_00023940 [Nothophytophthora sp. Chile5]|nr:hypothetical protein BBJ28_00023940 [Nothophytophthora sp. Chile5]
MEDDRPASPAPPAPPAPSSPPPSPPAHSPSASAAPGTPGSAKKSSAGAQKARRTAKTPPSMVLLREAAASVATNEHSGSGERKSGQSSSFSSPLPPCPEDPPAPPPPSCTPPKYRPLEENANTEDERDDVDSVEGPDEPVDPQVFPTPPPPPSPPLASPLGTPPPPPPPPFSPPNAKIDVDLSDALQSAMVDDEAVPPLPEETSQREQEHTQSDEEAAINGDDEREDLSSQASPPHEGFPSTAAAAATSSSSSSVIASMRSAASEREIMATETVRETPTKKPRFYIGDIDNYSIIDKVGSGTYGEVFKCQHKVTKDIVALKKLRPDVEKNGVCEGKRPPLYFAFEYMEHDLSGLLNHPRVKFSRTQIQCYMRQLLTGIAFMHRNKIIHRDIKASNLLLNNQGMLKVGDFGLSRFWNEVNAKAGRYTNKVVTLWYRPPELLMGSTSYDFSVDVWSIGCIFGELLMGKPILQGKTEIEQVIVGGRGVVGPLTTATLLRADVYSFPPHAIDLLEKLLQLDPAKRISAAEAMDHDYFWRVQTCKPRDLPKFGVSSTHEYQSKKRHNEERAAAAASGNGHGTDQHRNVRQRGERGGYRERNDHYRSGGTHHHSHGGRADRSRPYRPHRPSSDYYDRDRDRSRSRSRERHRERGRGRDREREASRHP